MEEFKFKEKISLEEYEKEKSNLLDSFKKNLKTLQEQNRGEYGITQKIGGVNMFLQIEKKVSIEKLEKVLNKIKEFKKRGVEMIGLFDRKFLDDMFEGIIYANDVFNDSRRINQDNKSSLNNFQTKFLTETTDEYSKFEFPLAGFSNTPERKQVNVSYNVKNETFAVEAKRDDKNERSVVNFSFVISLKNHYLDRMVVTFNDGLLVVRIPKVRKEDKSDQNVNVKF